MKVICINANNRPNEVPASRWIKKDQEYTVREVCKLNIQGGILGFKLEEINNDDLSPWEYFRADRFRPVQPDEVVSEELEEILTE